MSNEHCGHDSKSIGLGFLSGSIHIGSRRTQLDIKEWDTIDHLSHLSFNGQICYSVSACVAFWVYALFTFVNSFLSTRRGFSMRLITTQCIFSQLLNSLDVGGRT